MYVESEAKEKQQSMKNHKIMCFYGEQVKGRDSIKSIQTLTDQSQETNKTKISTKSDEKSPSDSPRVSSTKDIKNEKSK